MKAAIITIGDEILIGQIIDTNSAWIAEQLNLAGIQVKEIKSIADDHDAIISVLKEYESVFDLVILTGGLGPTKDDITKNCLSEFFKSTMILSDEVLNHIKKLFKSRGFGLSEVNKLQAMVPHNCEIIQNDSGTAPGMWFEKSSTIYVSMPGVPFEMKGIVSNQLLPKLQKKLNGEIILHKTIMTQGVPESYLADKISNWEDGLNDHLKLAYLPRPGIVRLRLTAIGNDKDQLNVIVQKEIDKLLNIIPNDVFAFDDISLEKAVVDLLKKKKLSVATAESCTGGKIASYLTSVPGSSACFTGSVIAYSNDVKIKELGVSEQDLLSYGAVSKQVVSQMAKAVREKMNTDFGIASSGIAGPEGGSDEKPVGTIWIAVCGKGFCVEKRFIFGEHRGRNIERASMAALNMLRKSILGINILKLKTE